MQKLLDIGVLNDKKILDYGCGYGVDVSTLIAHGFNIFGYDKYNQNYNDLRLLNDFYDVVTCHYVFNVIPSLNEHEQLSQFLKQLGNEVYISVRADLKAVKDSWNYDDKSKGYWTSTKTFQRFYDKDMVKELFGKDVDFIKATGGYLLFKLQ